MDGLSVAFHVGRLKKDQFAEAESVNDVPVQLGTITYDLLSVRFNWRDILTFCEKWDVREFDINTLKKNQQMLARACMLWLSKEPTKRTDSLFGDSVFVPPDLPSPARLLMYPLTKQIAAKVQLGVEYGRSERTRYRQEAEVRTLKQEIAWAEEDIEYLEEELSKETATIPFWEEGYEEKLKEAARETKNELNRTIERLNYSRRRLGQVFYQGYDSLVVTYEVADIVDACWLEVFTAVQYDIPAVQCSCCRRWIMIPSTRRRVCPECDKKRATAYRNRDKVEPWLWEEE